MGALVGIMRFPLTALTVADIAALPDPLAITFFQGLLHRFAGEDLA